MSLSVTTAEFTAYLKKCRPPSGWPRRIAVANSGGPDSTCLLFLLKRYISNSGGLQLPEDVISFSVNHNLQSSANDMASQTARIAASLDVKHYTSSIKWSEPPFPPLPPPGKSIETIARNLRYHLLFERMKETGTGAIAFGHHVDDQVETALMRMSKGTTELGAGGMRACRRWGMDTGAIPQFKPPGIEGMSRWIVRPLLDIPKARLLATCEENNLEYVVDPTNFQPNLTLRNYIRYHLTNNLDKPALSTEQPPNLDPQLQTVQTAISSLHQLSAHPTQSIASLRAGIKALNTRYTKIQTEVSTHLKTHTLPSPPGTLTLRPSTLTQITDETVRSALILRVLRYVSPFPWGSTRAEADRNQLAIQRLVNLLWHPEPSSFAGKSGVQWTLGSVSKNDGSVSLKAPKKGEKEVVWIASRANAYSGVRLDVDVTEGLVEANGRGVVQVLWDNRFAVRFDASGIPPEVMEGLQRGGRIAIDSHGPWNSPRISMSFEDPLRETRTLADEGWITTQFIRVLDAI